MIFASAGHRAPFNRLMRVLDGWSRANPGIELFAQVGEGGYVPRNFRSTTLIFGEDVGSVQVALAQRVSAYPGLFTALGETDLVELLDGLRDKGTMAAAPKAPDRRQLIAAIVGEAAP